MEYTSLNLYFVHIAGEKPEMDHNPPILYHNSRGRSTSSCNCGKKQSPREDPFDIQAANYDFYQVSNYHKKTTFFLP